MIHENVELHGIEEVYTTDGQGGVWLQRVPESVRQHLNEGAVQRSKPRSPEIRFVADGPVTVTLASEADSGASVFYGRFGTGGVVQIGSEPQEISVPPPPRLDGADPALFNDMPFSPRVRRGLMLAGLPLRLIAVEGASVRPPRSDEVPRLRLLTYGTSITHEAAATAAHLSYVAQTAWRLGADLINLGVGGSCQCEKELADWIADRKDWHVASLALSVNMRAFDPDEYTRRLHYMVDRVAGADTSRPVACITLWPFFQDFGKPWSEEAGVMTPEFMRQTLRDAVKAAGHANLHLLEGPEMLTDIGGLTADLIHPADNGMIQMGENLANRLKPLVK